MNKRKPIECFESYCLFKDNLYGKEYEIRRLEKDFAELEESNRVAKDECQKLEAENKKPREGTEKMGRPPIKKKCPTCKGTGKIRIGANEEPDIIICPNCNGRGFK